MTDIDDKLKNFRKELIDQEDKDAAFKRWFRGRVYVWSFILLVIIVTIMSGVGSAEAQETGPVNEGEWVVPETAIVVCPAFVQEVDPNVCVNVTDNWGPYPTKERCDARIEQMAHAFPSILTMQSGIPHWSMITEECHIPEPEGVDA